MRLRVLVDNHTYIDQYYLGEPAVSYYLEIDGLRILFDTGYSDIVLRNAAAMGIDLGGLTHIVLSHGHNDHTRGLQFLRERFDLSHVELVAHPGCFRPKWADDGMDIGAPFGEPEAAAGFRYLPRTGPYALSENCVFLGEIPTLHDFERRRSFGRTLDAFGAEAEELVLDDSALACRTEAGLFIVTGCSHSGICNLTDYARRICGEDRVAGIIGGFHLFDADERLRKTIGRLREISPRTLYPCHCVSLRAKAEMMKVLPVEEVGVGLTIAL